MCGLFVAAILFLAGGVLTVSAIDTTANSTEAGEEQWSSYYGEGVDITDVSVVDDVVYYGADDELVARDADTGVRIWSVDRTTEHAPSVIDGTVYAVGDRYVSAHDATDGSEKWGTDVEPRLRSTPLVYEGTVYVLYLSGGIMSGYPGGVAALDAETGDELWRAHVTRHSTGANDLVAGDGTIFFSDDWGSVYAIDAETGDTEWESTEFLRSPSSPTYADGTLYVTGAETVESGCMWRVGSCIADDDIDYRTFEHVLVAIDAETGDREWAFTDGEEHVDSNVHSPTFVGEHGSAGTVYFHSEARETYAIDAGDGSERWSHTLDDGRHITAPTVAGEFVFVYSIRGSGDAPVGVHALDRQTGEEAWVFDTESRTGEVFYTANHHRPGMLIADGTLYVPSGDPRFEAVRLHAIDAGVTGSSVDSRDTQGAGNHHDAWSGGDPDPETETVSAELETDAIIEGDEVVVNVTVRNNDATSSNHELNLELDGKTVLSTSTPIPEYGDRVVTMSHMVDDPGAYNVTVDGVDVGLLFVTDEEMPVAVTAAELDESTVWDGTEYTVTGTVENIGDVDVDDWSVNITADGDSVMDHTFPLDAGQSASYSFDFAAPDPGAYEIAVDRRPAGTLEVRTDPTYVTDTALPHDRIWVEDDVPVDLTVRNMNEEESEAYLANFLVNIDPDAYTTPAIPPGEEETHSAAVSVDEPGVYDLAVEEFPFGDGTQLLTQIGTVEVFADPIQFSSASVPDAPLEPGEPFEIGFEFENVAAEEQEHTVEIELDGDPVTEETITIPARSVKNETIELPPIDEEGIYTLTVDDPDTDAGDIEEPIYVADFDLFVPEGADLSAVLSEASDGDTVVVEPGDYPAPVVVSANNITLIGMDHPRIVGDGDGAGIGTHPVDNLSIEGFHVDRIGVGIDLTQTTDATILDNRITNATEYAIEDDRSFTSTWIDQASGNEIDGNIIRDSGSGIFTDYVTGLSITNNTIEDVETTAIRTEVAERPAVGEPTIDIAGNEIANASHGVTIRSVEAVTVTDNAITNVTGGVSIDRAFSGASTPNATVVSGNTVSEAVVYGIDQELNRNNTIVGNDVDMTAEIPAHLDQEGIRVTSMGESENAFVRENVVTGAERGIMLDSVVGTVEVTDNVLSHGLMFEGSEREHFIHDIADNVLANGDPIRYVGSTNGVSIDEQVGQLIVVNATNTTADIGVLGTAPGIMIAYSADTTIDSAEIDETPAQDTLIQIRNANGTLIENATLTGEGEVSAPTTIDIEEADGVTLQGLVINGTQELVAVESAANLTIAGSDISTRSTTWLWDIEGLHVLNNTWKTSSFHVGLYTTDAQIRQNSVIGESIDVVSSNATIAENLVSGSPTHGITASSGAKVRANYVTESAEYGIRVRGEGAAIIDNVLSHNTAGGIGSDGSVDARIIENEIFENTGPGIDLDVSTDVSENVTIVRNEIRNNEDGIQDDGTRGLRVIDNVIRDNTGHGIHSDYSALGDEVRISGNVISGSEWGIEVEHPDDPIPVAIEQNIVRDNNVGISVRDGGQTTTIARNHIADNEHAGLWYVVYGEAETLEATNNWWGDVSGPSGEWTDPETEAIADGDGDAIDAPSWGDDGVDHVRFDSWLTTDGTLFVEVSDEDGDPIADATVTASDGDFERAGVTDSDGVAPFLLADGEYDIHAVHPHYDPTSISGVTVDEADPTTIDLTLGFSAEITGEVTDADTSEPIEGATVTVRVDDEAIPIDTASTDADGTYAVGAADGFTNELTVSATGYEDAVDELKVDDELAWDIALEPAPIQERDAWPQYAFSATNPGHAEGLSGPSGPVTERWSFPIPDLGFPSVSPVIVDEVAYLGADDETVYAIDITDGSEVWQTPVDGEIWASPAYDDGLVYVGDMTGTMYALDDSDGEILWDETIGEAVRGPVTVSDGVVFAGTDDGAGVLYALDADDGSTLWTFETGAPIRTAPAVDGDLVYVGSETLYALDTTTDAIGDTEREHWNFTPAEHALDDSAPTVADGVVYIGSDGGLHAVDASDGSELWVGDADDEVGTSPAITAEYAVVGTGAGTVQAFDRSTGDEAWSADTGAINVRGSPTVADETVFVGSVGFDSAVLGIDIETGEISWQHDTENVHGSVVILDGVAYTPVSSVGLIALEEDVSGPVLDILDADVSDTEVLVEETVNVTATVQNVGDMEDTFEVTLADQLEDGSQWVQGNETVTLAPGESTDITFEHSFGTAGTWTVFVENVTAGVVNVTEPPTGTLTGTVTDTADDPIEQAQVEIYENGDLVDTAFTDATGGYTIELPDGTYDIVVSAAGYHTTTHDGMPLNVDATTTFDIELEALSDEVGTIEGVVMDDETGIGIEDAEVWVTDGDDILVNTTTDENGFYELNVEAGTYDLHADAFGYQLTTLANVTVVEETTDTWNLHLVAVEIDAAGTVAGLVVDANDAEPIEGTTVMAIDEDGFPANETDTAADGTYSLLLEAGTYDLVFDADGYVDRTEIDVTIAENETTVVDTSLEPDTFIPATVAHVDGTAPTMDEIGVNAFMAAGQLQIQLENMTAPVDDELREHRDELAGLGADGTTVFEIEVTVPEPEPVILVGAGEIHDWERTDNTDGTWNVTLEVSPIAQESIVDCDGYADGCVPPMDEWPEGDDDVATVGYEATVGLVAPPLSDLDEANQSLLVGMSIGTDAQAFGTPLFDPDSETLSLFVAGPAETVDGEPNEGIYDAFIPDALLDEWGVENPEAELTAAFDGDPADFTATDVAGGVDISVDIGYSAGTVTISTAEPDEPSVADYANDDDVVDTDGLREAVDDWRAGEVDTDLLRTVVDYWRSGEPVS